MKERHVTIKEVARKAGVGIATVSRVLNNSARVDPHTRERVVNVIRRLGYRPNAQGRRLVKRATEMVCFVLSNRDFMNPFHSGILCGAQKFLAQAGHDVVFTSLRYAPETAPDDLALPRILTHRGIADGVILAGTNYGNLLAAMDQLRIPYVLFGNNVVGEFAENEMPHADAVYYDECSSASGLAQRLIELGHRDIWFVGDVRLPWFRRRRDCYREMMRQHGFEPREFTDPLEGDYRDYGVAYGSEAASQILQSGRPVTAIYGGNDGIAYGVWRTLTRHGCRVPDDISLAGFDDVNEAHLTEPALTTVRVDTERIGQECARLLIERLADPQREPQSVLVPTAIVERGSWAAPPVQPPRFIAAVNGDR